MTTHVHSGHAKTSDPYAAVSWTLRPQTRTVDLVLLSYFAEVPSARCLSVTDRPSGVLVYLALEDPADEEAAYEALGRAQAIAGDQPLKMVSVTVPEWEALSLSSDSRRYRI